MVPVEIVEMTTEEDIEIVQGLLRKYVQWLFDSFPDETEDLSSYYSPERLQQAVNEIPAEFVPPKGIALIAWKEGRPVGCVLGHVLEPGIAEMKRLFIVPNARGNGLGSTLVKNLKGKMASWGYPALRLDTAAFLTDAISLYRQLGFVEIEPYTEIPPGATKSALFMEWR
jgi:GNAT superfamily N-acetyltransferase